MVVKKKKVNHTVKTLLSLVLLEYVNTSNEDNSLTLLAPARYRSMQPPCQCRDSAAYSSRNTADSLAYLHASFQDQSAITENGVSTLNAIRHALGSVGCKGNTLINLPVVRCTISLQS